MSKQIPIRTPRSLKELQELREEVNTLTDDQIEEMLQEAWSCEDETSYSVDDEIIRRIKNNIDSNIGQNHRGKSLIIRWMQIAATILLPIFIVLTYYFYQENTHIFSNEMIVATGAGERANITLPDGTKVGLNVNSSLSYHPKNYNRKERNIQFTGEGYFKVHKNKEVPFLINARNLQVTVMGTTFNLRVREIDNSSELALEEGSVKLSSTQNSRSVMLKPGQKAVFNQITGQIEVVEEVHIENYSAWQRGDLIFRNAKLVDVLKIFEDNYDIRIDIVNENALNELFTGTLPANNLNEALEVLEHSFHMQATLLNKVVY